MPLSPGQRIEQYEVVASIGRGAMGEVWRARDLKLGRDVAIKVLTEPFGAHPDRLLRLEREAQVLASINHPGIAAIYGTVDIEGAPALVLEVVEGRTLEERIAQGPIPLDEAVPLAKQIVEALEAAHDAGVVHRDLKPANIKLRPDGRVKILDFGLAKAAEGPGMGPATPSISTVTVGATQIGTIMGTAAYMSPEQARGRTVDRRADIWAVGAMLFEMVAGTRPFDGEDVSVILADVIRAEPDWTKLPEGVEPGLLTVLKRTLHKDPRERIRDVGDVRLALDGAFETPEASLIGRNRSTARARRRVVPWAAGFVLAAATGLTVWMLTPSSAPSALPTLRFAIDPGDQAPLVVSDSVIDLAISPDGTRVVYNGLVRGTTEPQLFVRVFDELVATPVRGGERGLAPFFSPDGQSVGFFDGSALWRVPTGGGNPITITRVQRVLGASWGDDDTITFATADGGLSRVPAQGGEPVVLTEPDTDLAGGGHFWPDVLPGSSAVLFTNNNGQTVEQTEIIVLDLDTGVQKRLVSGSRPRYVSSGHIAYVDGGTLWTVPFNPRSLEITGDALPMLDGVMTKDSGAGNFSTADNGALIYVPGGLVESNVWALVWVDREGREQPLRLPAGRYANPRVSPDGERVAVSLPGDDSLDIWVFDLQSGSGLRLTHGRRNSFPLWTADGQYIVFSSTDLTESRRAAGGNLSRIPADGSGPPQRLTRSDENQALTGLSPDGLMLYTSVVAPRHWEIVGIPMEGGNPRPLVTGPFRHGSATVSPDGRWVAYRSDETGDFEIYVQPYPGLGTKVPVSVGGGVEPVWSRDSTELFYRRPSDRSVVTVTVEAGTPPRVGRPRSLFRGLYVTGGAGVRAYDVAPDGRFLMVGSATLLGEQLEMVFIQNWMSALTSP